MGCALFLLSVGVYYRKDIFDKLGLFEPNTWVQFKYICETLKKNGIAPITIGTGIFGQQQVFLIILIQNKWI